MESVKAVSDLYSPASGTVTEVNEALKDSPEKLNTEPHSAWIIKVELQNPGELTLSSPPPTTNSSSPKRAETKTRCAICPSPTPNGPQCSARSASASIDELFSSIPEEYRLTRDLNVPRQMGESEIVDHFKAAAQKNANGYASFLGAGAYRHYRPVVIDTIVQRGEFLTSYTPYQAEITQGTLQAIFEFQTMICELTGMDIANASMYDGSTGAAEAVMMAVRVTGRDGVLVAPHRAS